MGDQVPSVRTYRHGERSDRLKYINVFRNFKPFFDFQSGTARPSGVKGKLILKSYHEYVGVFKPVAKHGCEDFFKIMGTKKIEI